MYTSRQEKPNPQLRKVVASAKGRVWSIWPLISADEKNDKGPYIQCSMSAIQYRTLRCSLKSAKVELYAKRIVVGADNKWGPSSWDRPAALKEMTFCDHGS